ncbi:MAG: beta-lactamase family protein [SAR202 cluster bacterium]|nr:beta-lactamase family protein [SAR202 cluster bacterium]|tara:strand:- start:1121 stop:2350 length:1230 start_codon:yes stop_codon:yes gene_type:complete
MNFELTEKKLTYIENHIQENYIQTGRFSCGATLYYHKGEVIDGPLLGLMDIERGKHVTRDTIFRIFSMTKPITSVAFMRLYELGLVSLDDPVHKFIPSWKDLIVYQSGNLNNFFGIPPSQPMTIKHLLTHQSGLSYGIMSDTKVDQAYRTLINLSDPNSGTLEDLIEVLSNLPLLFTPGSAWNYSLSTDVLGFLISIISDMDFDDYLKKYIFDPLEMKDTDFYVPDEKIHRLAANYVSVPSNYSSEENFSESEGLRLIDDPLESIYGEKPAYLSGGGGLVSTLDDYMNFSRMLLNKGGLGDAFILNPETVELMTQNHIPNNNDLNQFAMTGIRWAESSFEDVGFGLGFSTQTADTSEGSKGQYGWGGAASTYFWIDPQVDLICIFMTQFVPSYTYDIRNELKRIVYSIS